MPDIHYQSATEMLESLRSGAMTSVALTEALIARINSHNPNINALVTLAADDALKQAAEADTKRQRGESLGPLHGLPMTLKDTWEVAGLHCVAGAPALRDYVPEHNADLVQRLRDTGAIILGKTNVPLYAMDLQSYNRVFGTTNNPYNPEHTPGGSSGGAAAALAAGLTPLDVGSDLAGSVRTPAHYCGVFGHKATQNLISMRGHIPGPPGTLTPPDLVVAGPMARTAKDLETLLNVVAGPRPVDARSWSLNMEPARISELSSARVGLWLSDPLCPVDSHLTGAYRALGQKLEHAGSLVAEAKHDLLDMNYVLPAYFNLLGSLVSGSMKPKQRRQMGMVARFEPWIRRFFPMTAYMGEYGRGVNQPIYQWASWTETRLKMRARIDELFKDFDVLLTPITPTAAPRHNQKGQTFTRRITVNGEQRPYTDQFCWIAFATLLGLPATSVPIGRTAEGLPYNVQVIGAPGSDLTTLKFAQLLEQEGLAGFSPPPGY
ncbi:amidase [Marinobacter sp. 1Y8]